MNNVMVFTPVYRLETETIAALMALEFDGALTFHLQRDNPHAADTPRKTGVINHLHQYQRGRDVFLRGDYDAMLVIESDIIPPPDTLTRLIALDADLAYGCYLFRVTPVVNIFQAYPRPSRNPGESLSVRPGLWKKALQGGIVDCSGAGLGCVLIKRHVIEAVPFRIFDANISPVHCDSYFTADVWAKTEFTMRADTAVQCGHIREDGTVLWPTGAEHEYVS